VFRSGWGGVVHACRWAKYQDRNRQILNAARRGRPFQFGTRVFFVFTLIMALVLPGLTSDKAEVRSVVAIAIKLAFIVSLVTAAVRKRGYCRTFCVGALAPHLMSTAMFVSGGAILASTTLGMVFPKLTDWHNVDTNMALLVALDIVVCVVCGICAIGIHYILEPSGREDQKPAAKSKDVNEERERGQSGRRGHC
jgi:hypothetical protein